MTTGNILGQEKTQDTVFGIIWDSFNDTCKPAATFNPNKKNRGSHTGKNLQEMTPDEISKLPFTKTLGSRILGQRFDPSGRRLSTLKTSLKTFLMEICGYTKLWKEDISQYDPELAQRFRQLLTYISKYEFQPWPRCIQPADTKVIAIHQAGDASISAA